MLSLGLSHKSKYISNITRLYLNDCRLTKLPNFLSQLTNIQEKDLKNYFMQHTVCIHTAYIMHSLYSAMFGLQLLQRNTRSRKVF